MKKTYLTPSTRVIAIKGGFCLLQRHSVRDYITVETRYIGDDRFEDIDDVSNSSGSRYVGDIDEE